MSHIDQNRPCKELSKVALVCQVCEVRNEDFRNEIAFIVIAEISFSFVPINSEQSNSLKDFLVGSLNDSWSYNYSKSSVIVFDR